MTAGLSTRLCSIAEDARRRGDGSPAEHQTARIPSNWHRSQSKGGVMFHNLMSLILAGLLILNSSVFVAAAATEQTGTVADLQVKARNAIERHKQVVVITRSEKDGTKKFPGTISEVSDKGLTLVENKTGRTMAMSYEEI